MPTEVSPAPFRFEQQFPIAMEHPSFYSSSLGRAGPAPLRACMSGPGTVMPNGVRNPWAPYAGENYQPANEAAGYIHDTPAVSIRPRAGFGGGGGGMAPRPMARLVGGSMADADGWDGMSHGRYHNAHAPDLGSNAGSWAGTSWHQRPSSWQNHARMTPRVIPAAVVDTSPVDPCYLAPPVAHSPRRRAPSVGIDDYCASCAGESKRGHHHRSASMTSRRERARTPSHGHRRHESSPVMESPLRRVVELPLVRQLSRSSSGRCSECSRH